MDLMDLLKVGGSLIQGNSDDATTGLDVGDIANALGGLLGNSEGGLDLGSLVGGLSQNGLGEIVGLVTVRISLFLLIKLQIYSVQIRSLNLPQA